MCGLTTENYLFNDEYSIHFESNRLGCVRFKARLESIEHRNVDESSVLV